MNTTLQLSICPSCGSDKIQQVVKDITRSYKGQAYIVPAVTFYACPNCGENVYDATAMQKIQAYSPAYHHAGVLAEH